MIVVKAILQAQPGKEHELEKRLNAMIPNVQTEEGTLEYRLHRAQNTPGQFLFYERYRNQQACDAHMATPYLQELLQQIEGLLRQAPDVELFEEIAGFHRTEG